MKKTILLTFILGFTGLNSTVTASYPSQCIGESRSLEYTVVRVKYSLKKTGIMSKVYADIGNSQSHSLVKSLVTVSDGVFKIGYGKETTVLSNEVDMLNYFSSNGWEVVRISEVKIMSSIYTQYLFSKEAVK